MSLRLTTGLMRQYCNQHIDRLYKDARVIRSNEFCAFYILMAERVVVKIQTSILISDTKAAKQR
jgi:hypothetical protein